MTDPLLSVADIAARLHLTPSGAYKWLIAKGVRMVRPGRKLLVRESVFEAAVSKYTVGGLYERAQHQLRRAS